jgi:hypothetical protein
VRRAPVASHGGVAGHAAVLGAPGTSRVLAMLELKNALEEELATRLGVDRPPHTDELPAKTLAAGIFDAAQVAELARLLGQFARVEAALLSRPRSAAERVRDADVVRAAARVRALLAPRVQHGEPGAPGGVLHSKQPP